MTWWWCWLCTCCPSAALNLYRRPKLGGKRGGKAGTKTEEALTITPASEVEPSQAAQKKTCDYCQAAPLVRSNVARKRIIGGLTCWARAMRGATPKLPVVWTQPPTVLPALLREATGGDALRVRGFLTILKLSDVRFLFFC